MTSPFLDAITHLQAGNVIAYATEAVFGLGCDPDNEAAVHKLLAIKQRPVDKGLILIAADWSQLTAYVDDERLTDVALRRITSYNVCYTKLLRASRRTQHLTGARIADL